MAIVLITGSSGLIGGESVKFFHDKGRVSFSGRGKILLDPEMNLQFTVFKPASAARREIGRFFSLRNSENSLIEFPRIAFPAGRHCEQDMIQPANAHLFTFPKAIETQRLRSRKSLSVSFALR